MTPVQWDYSNLAEHYDRRVDYAPDALARVAAAMGLAPGSVVADIGAGTGKLTRPLVSLGFRVEAVEPNGPMRARGQANLAGAPVTWQEGQGETLPLADHSVEAVFFGSSFNVVEPQAALAECERVLRPGGWFCCLWNHRDLEDPLQASIEALIRARTPGYTYGSRRQDPTALIEASRRFQPPQQWEERFMASVPREDFLLAWRSHGTLARQAGEAFEDILKEIEALIPGDALLQVPYTTRLWFAQLKHDH